MIDRDKVVDMSYCAKPLPIKRPKIEDFKREVTIIYKDGRGDEWVGSALLGQEALDKLVNIIEKGE